METQRILSWFRCRPLVAVIFAGVLVCLIGFLGRGWYRNRLAEQESNRLRALGFPTNAAELNTYVRSTHDDQGTIPLWEKVFRKSQDLKQAHHWDSPLLQDFFQSPPPPGKHWMDLTRESQFIQDQSEYYQLVEKALAVDEPCCFVRDYRPAMILLPHIAGLRSVHRFLALRAFVHSHQQETSSSAADLLRMLQATETLSKSPTLIDQIMRIRMHNYTMSCLEQLLPSLATDEEALRQIQYRIQKIDLKRSLHQGLVGQRAEVVGHMNESVQGRLRGAWHGDDPLSVLLELRELEEALEKDWSSILSLRDTYEQNIDFRTLGARSPWSQRDVPPSEQPLMIASRVEPTIVAATRLRVATAAIAAMRFRSATGDWPKTPEDLVPEYLTKVPTDPCSGSPIRMNLSENVLCIYGVGVDGIDDGGREVPTKTLEDELRCQGEPDVSLRLTVE